MATLQDWILEMAGSEEIEAVVLGYVGAPTITTAGGKQPNAPLGVLLTWEQALPWLQYKFDDGFGAVECHSVYAWTPTKVIAIEQYDGSTSPFAIPRNPTACFPMMPGGS